MPCSPEGCKDNQDMVTIAKPVYVWIIDPPLDAIAIHTDAFGMVVLEISQPKQG